MRAQELVDELIYLICKYGDKEVFFDGLGVMGIDYNVNDDCFDIDTL